MQLSRSNDSQLERRFFYMKLSEWLRSNDVSPADFAGRVGVHRSTVGRWIDPRSDAKPDWDVLPRIIEATDGAVTANDFLDGEGKAA